MTPKEYVEPEASLPWKEQRVEEPDELPEWASNSWFEDVDRHKEERFMP